MLFSKHSDWGTTTEYKIVRNWTPRVERLEREEAVRREEANRQQEVDEEEVLPLTTPRNARRLKIPTAEEVSQGIIMVLL